MDIIGRMLPALNLKHAHPAEYPQDQQLDIIMLTENVHYAVQAIPTIAVRLWFGFQLKAEKSTIPILAVAIWTILSMLQSQKHNREDSLLVKSVINKEGLIQWIKPFLISLLDLFDTGWRIW